MGSPASRVDMYMVTVVAVSRNALGDPILALFAQIGLENADRNEIWCIVGMHMLKV